jgi:hypothetical protein
MSEFGFEVTGHWSIVNGQWSAVIGKEKVIGHWSIVIGQERKGHQPLVPGRSTTSPLYRQMDEEAING